MCLHGSTRLMTQNHHNSCSLKRGNTVWVKTRNQNNNILAEENTGDFFSLYLSELAPFSTLIFNYLLKMGSQWESESKAPGWKWQAFGTSDGSAINSWLDAFVPGTQSREQPCAGTKTIVPWCLLGLSVRQVPCIHTSTQWGVAAEGRGVVVCALCVC